jgi:hypothetical protein
MGRLTLNVLLSFAQFEREVIGERVRDKVAASKRKGLWMGGPPPFGYINQDKKLIIVPDEAETVRRIFRRYLELGTMGALLEELNRTGARTRVQIQSGGQSRGGVLFRKGTLAHLLKNRCYVGEILHRGQIHSADHAPIIDRSTFDAVQARLAANGVARNARLAASPFLLMGQLFDSAGHPMSPTHTKRKGVRYRYYASQALLQGRKGEAGEVSRVPAPDIEAAVLELLCDRLGVSAAPDQARPLVAAHVRRITVYAERLEVALLESLAATDGGPEGQGARILTAPWVRKPYRATKGVVHAPSLSRPGDPRARDILLEAIGKARQWVEQLTQGQAIAAIAREEGKGERQIRLLLPLAFVPPNTVRQIIDGAIPIPTVSGLARAVPLVWPS